MKWASLLFVFLLAVSCVKEPCRKIIEPADKYVGHNSVILLDEGCEEFKGETFTLTLRASSGEKIKRSGIFRVNRHRQAELQLDYGISDDRYELLNLEYVRVDEDGKAVTERYGLGCCISFENGDLRIHSKWNARMQMFGSGTEVDTLRISSEDKIEQLRRKVNDFITNEEVDMRYYFLQTDDLDGWLMSDNVSWEYGWLPIGSQAEVPFRSVYDGGGYSIEGLTINREYMYGAGLFGYIDGAHIKDVHIKKADIRGDMGVSALVGVVISGVTTYQGSFIEGCSVSNSTIRGVSQSYGVGGLVGVVDMYSGVMLDHCSSASNTISAHSQAGGVVGAGSRTSIIVASFCENSSNVTTEYNSCGGIVASCDTLQASGCINRGAVNGAVDFTDVDQNNMLGGVGAGGIAGGASCSNFLGCANYGPVQGKTGVGGILGSTRLTGSLPGENLICNDAIFFNNKNEGSVTGRECVGGLCGEAQVMCRENINTGMVTAEGNYAGGLVGMSPLAMIHNNLNKGAVKAYQYAGGIIGMAPCSFLAVNQNMSNVLAQYSHAGGIIASAGNDATVHYCGNFGDVQSDRKDFVGGIAGEYGTPEGPMDYVSIVVATTEVIGAVAGVVVSGIACAKEISEAFSWAGLVWSVATAVVDGAATELNILSIVDNDKIRDINENNLAKLDSIALKISYELEEGRNAAELDTQFFGLDEKYKENLDRLVDYLQKDTTTFTENANKAREERYGDVLQAEHDKEVIHTCVSGVCSAVALAASVAATALSLGGSAILGLITTCGGAIFTTVGAGNSIWQSLTTYEENVITVDQCIQAGYIFSPSGNKKAGGIVGQMNSYGVISDCINFGGGVPDGGHIAGYAGHSSTIKNCLTLAPADSWGGIYNSKESNADISGLYYFSESLPVSAGRSSMDSATPLTMVQLADPKSFPGWDFDAENGAWMISDDSDRPYPIPYISKFAITDNK